MSEFEIKPGLTGASKQLNFENSKGVVRSAIKRGRPTLYTSYETSMQMVNTNTKKVWLGLLILFALSLPFTSSGGWLHAFTLLTIYAIAGIGLNLLMGYAGQISLGHAFFMGLGAYTAAVVAGDPARNALGFGLDLAIALPLAAIIPGIVGLIVAPLATRVRGLYLAVLTLGLLFIGEQVFKTWSGLSGGAGNGRYSAQRILFGIDLNANTYAVGPFIFTPEVVYYLICLTLLIALAILAKNIARSKVGRAFAAVRDRDIAAEVMGVNLYKTKTLAFALSSAYAGIAGALLSILIGTITPEQWNLFMSIDILAIVVIGGVATISGSIIGAAFVVLLPVILRELTQFIPWLSVSSGGLINVFQLQTILFGTLIVVFVTIESRGLFGLWIRIRNYFKAWPFSY
ncbi:MAG: branched-chain amino acid ABC transporter permease [Microbacteriaceae bacterium]|nr:branched-chain amino acid ABC transporter permease [Microbacteriaceae bacterium]